MIKNLQLLFYRCYVAKLYCCFWKRIAAIQHRNIAKK